MATTPSFFATPVTGSGLVSAANTGLDGTGSLVTIISAVASDCKLEFAHIHARQTTTAGMVRLWDFDGTATYRLVAEIPIGANTISASNPAYNTDVDWQSQFKLLPSGHSLVSATHNAEAIFVEVYGVRS